MNTSSQSIAVLGPGDHIGLGASAYFSNATANLKMVVRALPEKWTRAGPRPSFTFSGTTFVDDRFSPKVTGIINSPFTNDYKTVRVTAIGLDGAGAIVGGNSAYIYFVPAGGQTAVSVNYNGAKPATVVLHPQLTSLSLLSQ